MQRQLRVSEKFTVLVAYRYSEDEEGLRTIRNLSLEKARDEVLKAMEHMVSGLVESVSVSNDNSPV